MKLSNVLFLAVVLGLTACDSDNDSNTAVPNPTPETKLQIVHASPDAPPVELILGGNSVVDGADYLQATPLLTQDAGSLTAEIKAILPGGEKVDALTPLSASFNPETIYTVFAVNDTANIEALVLSRADTTVTAGNARIQILHAAPDAPMVDVFATAPGADLTQSSPLVTASFKDSLDATEVPSGDYQIRITLAGDSTTVVYDSGTINLASGADLVIAAVENTGPGSQPVNLLLIDSTGANILLDTNTPASVRVVHASPDAPAVDVIANDTFASPLISNLSFHQSVGYVDLPADTYNIKVVPTGTTAPAVINADLTLEAGTAYNVIASDVLANIQPLVLTADNRAIATEAKLRVVHASPAAGDVDIYLVSPGTDINTVDPTLSDVPFMADTGFLSVTPEDYQVIVTAADSKVAAIGPADISLDAAGVYTIIAKDAVGGGTPLNVILLDDFVVQE